MCVRTSLLLSMNFLFQREPEGVCPYPSWQNHRHTQLHLRRLFVEKGSHLLIGISVKCIVDETGNIVKEQLSLLSIVTNWEGYFELEFAFLVCGRSGGAFVMCPVLERGSRDGQIISWLVLLLQSWCSLSGMMENDESLMLFCLCCCILA